MGQYRTNTAAVRDLVRETEVHRDVYVDEEIFELEMEHLFANAWVYVGHDSQVPESRRLLRHDDRHAARADGAAHRRKRAGAATIAVRTRARASPARLCGNAGQVLPLPLSRLELQDRRLAARDAVARAATRTPASSRATPRRA